MKNKKTKSEFSTLERRAQILDLIESKGKVSVSVLSEAYHISEVSVRNDLSHLEKKGLLIRTRGGAIKSQPLNLELSLSQKLKTNYNQKKRIGKKSADLVQDGFSIIIDSGSTALEVAKNLKDFKNIKLITNSLPIADICAEYKGIEIVVPGGELRKDMRSLVGPIAENSIKNFSCDLAFIGANSISVNKGIYTRLTTEAALGRAMISIAQKVVLVIDSSKFKKRSMVKICELKCLDTIITDGDIPKEDIDKLKELDLEVIIT